LTTEPSCVKPSSKDGYAYTPKGVRFVKRWHPRVTDVADVTISEGHRHAEEKPEKEPIPEKSCEINHIGENREKTGFSKGLSKASLTTKSGDMNDMSDTNLKDNFDGTIKHDRVVYICGGCASEQGLILMLAWEGTCELCGRHGAVGRIQLSKLKPEVSTSKPLKCPRCGVCFFAESDLNAHLRRVHGVEN
jgi:hypothetical protein